MKFFSLIFLCQLILVTASSQSAITDNKQNTAATNTSVTDTAIKVPAEKKVLLGFDQFRYSPQGVNISQISAGFSYKAKRDHIIAKFNSAFSEGTYSAQVFTEYYHNISKKDYINIILAGSDGKFYPAFVGGFSNFFVPGNGWEFQAGARIYAPKDDSRSLVFPVGVSKQIDKHFFGYTAYIVQQKKDVNLINNFNYRYYFKDNQFFSINYGFGKRYNIFRPENVTDIPTSRMKTQTFNALFTTPIAQKWNLELHFTYEHNKDPESKQDFNIFMPGVMVSRKL